MPIFTYRYGPKACAKCQGKGRRVSVDPDFPGVSLRCRWCHGTGKVPTPIIKDE